MVRVLSNLVLITKSNILATPSKVASEVVHLLSNPAHINQVKEIFDRSLHDALNDLANTDPRKLLAADPMQAESKPAKKPMTKGSKKRRE